LTRLVSAESLGTGRTDLVGDTQHAIAEAAQSLGRKPSIGILFNCVHRAIEMRLKQLERQFQAAVSQFPVVGFHSYGENYLAQLNQTLVGLILG